MGRDYDARHATLARHWRPYAYGRNCNRCGRPMLPGEDLDLDHADDGAGYIAGHPADSFSHAACNRAAGARTANRQRAERRATARAVARTRQPTPKGIVMKFSNVVFAVDIDIDREATYLVAAGRAPDDTIVIELAGQWPGGANAGPVAAALGDKRSVVLDPQTAGTLIEPLRRAGVTARELDGRDVRNAHGTFTDLFRAGNIKHVPSPVLTEAVRRAKVRKLAGRDELDLRSADYPPAPIRAASFAVTTLVTTRAPRIYV